jgi:hypothetical protein
MTSSMGKQHSECALCGKTIVDLRAIAILDRLGNNTTPGNATNLLEYENSTYGIKMQYPPDWRVEGASNSSIVASFYPQRNNAGYVMVDMQNLTTNYTPDQS